MKNPPSSARSRNNFAAILALFALAVVSTTGSAFAQLESGLVSYWDFESGFQDSASIFSADSTVDDNGVGGIGVVLTADGPIGTYGDFGRTPVGDDNVVKVPGSADLDASGESISISAWFRVDGFDQNWQALIAHGEGTDWRIARRAGSTRMAFAGGTGDLPGDNNTGPDVNDGQWHHVVAISENGVSTRIWIDNVLIAISPAAPTIASNGATEMIIGGNPDTNTGDTNANKFRAWNGGIDEVAIWNRVLTTAEVGEIFNAGTTGNSIGAILSTDDRDGDGLTDSWEEANGLDADDDGLNGGNPDNGADGDPDMDGLANIDEQEERTDPQDSDSDDDESTDGEEIVNGTLPLDSDTDNDRLLDGYETNDGNYVSATETGTDPLVSDLMVDSDGDGLFNVWEIENDFNPTDDGSVDVVNGAAGDPDMDGSDNLAEQTNVTDPQDADTDDDFSNDGDEATNGTDPLIGDSDGDGLLDGHETNNGLMSYVSVTDTGTNPLLLDTDGDGTNDDVEITIGTDPTDPDSKPIPSVLPIIDDFEDDTLDLAKWRSITGTISQNAQASVVGGNLTETGGSIEFEDRGYLHTAAEFDPAVVDGLIITGEMTFRNATDIFNVLTRSDPTPLDVYGEATSGVQFQISANADTLLIGGRGGDLTVANSLVVGTIDFVADTPYLFTVIDDGMGSLSMVVTQKDTPANTISITADLTADSSDSNYVTFYNREGGRDSSLEEISIRSLVEDVQVHITAIDFDTVNGTYSITWNSEIDATYTVSLGTDLDSWVGDIDDGIAADPSGFTTYDFVQADIFGVAPDAERIFFRVVKE